SLDIKLIFLLLCPHYCSSRAVADQSLCSVWVASQFGYLRPGRVMLIQTHITLSLALRSRLIKIQKCPDTDLVFLVMTYAFLRLPESLILVLVFCHGLRSGRGAVLTTMLAS
ncbi:unnamed protein product, partial [Fusarium graminearum]